MLLLPIFCSEPPLIDVRRHVTQPEGISASLNFAWKSINAQSLFPNMYTGFFT